MPPPPYTHKKDSGGSSEGGKESEDDKAKLDMSVSIHFNLIIILPTEQLKFGWHSPIYGFFKPKVTIRYDDKGQKYVSLLLLCCREV